MEILSIKKNLHGKTGRLIALLALAVVMLFVLDPCPVAEAASFKPDQVKAAFIYNLTNFVNLPEKTGSSSRSAYVIAVLGNRNIARYLQMITRGESRNGRPFVIKYADSPEELGRCHVLFVDHTFEEKVPELLEQLSGHCLLTVGESKEFLRAGGMVGLVPRGKRIQIVINLDAAEASGISFNSKLLRVASIERGGLGSRRREP